MNIKFFLHRKTIGFVFMLLGISMALYPLTSMSVNEYYASKRYEEFLKDQENIDYEEVSKFEHFTNEYNNRLGINSGKIVDPFDDTDYKGSYGLDISDKNKVFGYIKIEKIDAKKPIRFDANYENLSKGVAHVDGTSLPVGGKGTRSVIAGHRGWYTDVMFLNLHKLEEGDLVEVQLISGKVLKYAVKDKEIINPTQRDKISPIENKDILTLLTCDPMVPPSPQRLIVNCERLLENDIEDNKNQEVANYNYINYTKYSIYVATIFFWFILLGVLVKFLKYIIKK